MNMPKYLFFNFVVLGMLPGHMQHPFVDRYRDSHNASPRSLVDEDSMNPPSSGSSTYFYYTMIVNKQ